MIRILIADNEQEIRTEIRKLIEENMKFPLSIFEAKNGQEAMEIHQIKSANLLVLNVNMHLTNGVPLLQFFQKTEHKPEAIIVGESTKFENVRQALNYEAIDYILKPINKEEFLIAVSKAVKKITKTNRLYNEMVLRQSLLYGHADKKQKLQDSGLEKGIYCVAIFGNDCKKKLNRQFKSFPCYVLEEQKNFVLYVLPADSLETIKTWEFSWIKAMGISSVEKNLSQLRLIRSQAYSAAFQYFFSSNKQKKQRIFIYTDEMFIPDYSDFDTLYERFIGRLEFLQADEIASNLNNIFNFSSISEQKRGPALFYMYNKIISNLFKRFPGHVDSDDYLYSKELAIEDIWQAENLATWKTYIHDYLVYLATLLQNHTANYPFISDAIDYIKTHFTGSLTMAMVANHVSVNYTYFSEKFKEHTGINFNDYLKRIRIEEACRLLTEGFYKVYEVSIRSGFNDVKYFMRTFKELVGITPGEYRRSRNRTV